MSPLIKAALGASLLAAMGACASYDPATVDDIEVVLHEYRAVREMTPQGPFFHQGLRQGYLDYGDELYDGSDYPDFAHFAFKAVDSAKGRDVAPDMLATRRLPAASVDELAVSRARLVAALDQGGRKKAPWQAANAQVAYDCWLERTEEEVAPALIEECRGRFGQAIAEVERALVSDVNNTYLVFFAWDQTELTPVAQAVINQIHKDFVAGRHRALRLAGHADRSGSDGYNEPLSERRARTVAAALRERGLPEQALVVEWYGERRPRVATEDGARDPQNRRVEAIFQ